MAAVAHPAPGWDAHVHVFDAGAAAAGAHYRPVARPLAEIEGLAQAHGCGHLVLVQPSVYGSDNTLLLEALRASHGRHRGVVVVRGDEAQAELDAMHAAGVRGIRFNLVSPVGSARDDVAPALARIAPFLRSRGWHVQWYVHPALLEQLAQWQAVHALPFVLDHLAGLTPAHAASDGTWEVLRTLAAGGAWIKLSGWYRLQAQAPYGALHPLVRRAAALFDDRMVWGSDWPHTSFPPGELPPYASLWEPVVRALGEDGARRVREAGAALYA
ncbi:amidohydrolase family protein [Ramlibacter sp. USB13]|uniref:Amidohydrolase family protein n=1 Tax=Ramlibacter cellulosilyticus TaxID=2764187 RepID=A0A923MX57_9BURK|nr:amidohydrolase family protein [Ramlibacter cellulosilyticus]MBC5786318.1 amidohydrolase family protein [Ramlibacter cellulosilyticus]